jgi:hypothetical protein
MQRTFYLSRLALHMKCRAVLWLALAPVVEGGSGDIGVADPDSLSAVCPNAVNPAHIWRSSSRGQSAFMPVLPAGQSDGPKGSRHQQSDSTLHRS